MANAAERVRLSRRAAGATPEVEVVDMRRQGAGLLLAPRSREALAQVLRSDEQAIILLNRRGYAGYVYCDACGHVLMCADCELSLTYHRRGAASCSAITAAAATPSRPPVRSVARPRSPGRLRAPSGSTGNCGRSFPATRCSAWTPT